MTKAPAQPERARQRDPSILLDAVIAGAIVSPIPKPEAVTNVVCFLGSLTVSSNLSWRAGQ
jgi:hypothetical protein